MENNKTVWVGNAIHASKLDQSEGRPGYTPALGAYLSDFNWQNIPAIMGYGARMTDNVNLQFTIYWNSQVITTNAYPLDHVDFWSHLGVFGEYEYFAAARYDVWPCIDPATGQETVITGTAPIVYNMYSVCRKKVA